MERMHGRVAGAVLVAWLAGCSAPGPTPDGGDGSNLPPVLGNLVQVVAEDTTLAFTIDAMDPEGRPVTASVTGLQHGVLSSEGTGFRYVPNPNFNGRDLGVVTVSDGVNEVQGTLTITVTAVNDLPVANDDQLNAAASRTVTVSQAALRANDTDVDQEPLSVIDLANPSAGSVALVDDLVELTLPTGFNGAVVTFDYTLSDGTATDTATVTLILERAQNRAPLPVDDTLSTRKDVALTVAPSALLANDADPDSDTLVFVDATSPLHGSLSRSGTDVVFTPAAGFVGEASFDYAVTDGALTATAHVTVNVLEACGNGQLDANETCDDGAFVAGDGCSPGCAAETGFTCTGAPSVCVTTCGDGLVAGAEVCDDQDLMPGDGCSASCTVESGFACAGTPSVCVTTCGDGISAGTEACDDQNQNPNDGCTASCQISNGFTCTGAPSVCVTTCGDGIPAGTEACDDQNQNPNDGCTASCQVSSGFACTGAPSACTTTCGDGIVAGPEQCDDGNLGNTDGCSDVCTVRSGYTCVGSPSACTTMCGDGIPAGTEQCDDGNLNPADGCTASCTITDGYACAGSPSVCVTTCGDGLVAGTEQCDDGNQNPADGCTASCQVRPGFSCSGAPSVCATTCGDGYPTGVEQCDDGNLNDADGCTNACLQRSGYQCTGIPSVCVTTCGDGIPAGTEQCDDGNINPGDGCNASCLVSAGFTCAGVPSVCSTVCGDGIIAGAEACDDGNQVSTDGCTSQCIVGKRCDATAYPGADRFATDPATGTCYASFDDEQTTWSNAHQACNALGGYLATIADSAEQARVHAVQNTAQNPWIGATEDANDTDTVFDWFTNEPWTGYTNYAPGEPDDDVNFGGNGECLILVNAQGQWADTNCNFVGFVTGRICEFPVNTCGNGLVEPGESCANGP